MIEKRSVIFAISVILIILLAGILPSITGRITQPAKVAIVPEDFKSEIVLAQENTLPGELVSINKASIDKNIIEETISNPEETISMIVCFKEAAVDEAVKTAKNAVFNIQAETLVLPSTSAMAIKSFSHDSQIKTGNALPFKTEEKKLELEEIEIKKEAIQTLSKKFESISPAKAEVKRQFANFPCAKVDANLEGIEQMSGNLEANIMQDVIYKTNLKEAIEETDVGEVWKKEISSQYLKGDGITVAVIDSGIDYTHSDLGGCFGAGCKVSDGWNFIEYGSNVTDIDGHGTHLAGIISAVAPDASIIALKICEKDSCSASKIAEAIDWCLERGCNIATLSLGDESTHNPEECGKIETLRTVLETASSRGLAVFVSTGNNGLEWPSYPACDPNVISVGSVNDYDGKISEFSNRNPDIYAPGAPIKSTWINNEYRTMIGTSQAAAFASGVAALYIQAYSIVNKETPTVQIMEEQFETRDGFVYDSIEKRDYPNLNAMAIVENLLGANPLPSFVCGNSECEFELGEDAQNCAEDCGIETGEENKSPQEGTKNQSMSFDIRGWTGNPTNSRIEIRDSSMKILRDFSYPDEGTSTSPVELPKGNYNIKISIGPFSAIMKSIELNSDIGLSMKMEDLTKKVGQIQEMPFSETLASYGVGFEDNRTAIICFDKQLAGENSFVFRCPWSGQCEGKWSALMSMKSNEVSCIILSPGKETAYSVVKIKEAVCGNGICEQKESSASCADDCQMELKESSLGEEKTHVWKIAAIAAAAVVLAILIILLVHERRKSKIGKDFPVPPRPKY